ncbi:MAG: DUF2336 domain-containing protein [Rhodospirillales bacterium]|nr:DUF2336 domain-containing protein [Rhodospirillales bacterium]
MDQETLKKHTNTPDSEALPETVDTEHLFELARDKSAEGRNALAEAISDLTLESNRVLSERERALTFDILGRVIHEMEMSVRRTVATRLADMRDAPRDIVRLLASDDIEIAYPILTQSGVLLDADLIEIIRHRTLEHQLAIAIRHQVSEAVSDALVEANDENVISTLLSNQNAKISQSTMEYLVEESRRIDAFQEPILGRKDLDSKLIERMFLWVSAALRQTILEDWDLDPATVDALLEEATVNEVKSATRSSGPKTKAEELVCNLAEDEIVTPDLLLKALQDGEVTLFVGMLKQMTGLRTVLVNRIVFEPGGEGLAIVCKSLEMDKDTFADIFTLTRNARPAAAKTLQRDIRKIVSLYDRITLASAAEVVERWQRGTNYLAALRDLEISGQL